MLFKIIRNLPSYNNIRRKLNPGRRLVIVGMIDSTHFQKWVFELSELKLFSAIWLFPSDCPKSDFRRTYQSANTKIYRFNFKLGSYFGWAIFKMLDLYFGMAWRSLLLSRLLKSIKPHVIHFHEIQHGAYIFNSISKSSKSDAKVVTSTWGSDILLYGQVPSQIPAVTDVLSWTDILTSERGADLPLARELGFKGNFLAPTYITVGSEFVDLSKSTLTSLRRGIIIKGYQDVPGRALNIMRAIDLLGVILSGYEIYVYSTERSPAVRIQAELLAKKYGLSINLLPKMKHEELMEYFKKSRIYIGMSISDGLSTSMVEAMSNGVFPIQSENSAASEFIEDGVTGMILDPWNIDGISDAIRKSLLDDLMVDKAAIKNAETINLQYSLELGKNRISHLYS
jgi:glycosyltransferase involved in cell wall biosynthesis